LYWHEQRGESRRCSADPVGGRHGVMSSCVSLLRCHDSLAKICIRSIFRGLSAPESSQQDTTNAPLNYRGQVHWYPWRTPLYLYPLSCGCHRSTAINASSRITVREPPICSPTPPTSECFPCLILAK
jgi:hypothetical protein